MANRFIESGEELTFDYQFEYEGEAEKLECFCGSAICKGRLN
jgi:SET domain-containing protein